MHRISIAAMVVCGTLVAAVCTYSDETRSTRDFVEWLLKASEPNFVFLKGAHQDDYFFGVFSAGENQLAFCYCDLNVELNRTESTLSILDEQGNNLADLSVVNRRLVRTFEKQAGTDRNLVRLKWREVYGRVHPLKPGSPLRVRVVFEVKSPDEQEYQRVFNEIVVRGKSPAS